MKRQKKDLTSKEFKKVSDDLRNIPDTPPGSHLSDDEFVNYVMEHLSEEEVKRIDLHLAACEPCAAEMERLLEGAESWSGITGEQRMADVRRKAQKNEFSVLNFERFLGRQALTRYAAVAVVLLAVLGGTLWYAGPFPQTTTDRIAYIQENMVGKTSNIKGESNPVEQAYNAGIKSLYAAQKRQWLFFLYYDSSLAAEGINHLEFAYNNTLREFDRAEIAVYIARAHLMRKDFESAIYWLGECFAQQANEEKRREAAKILGGIENILKKEASQQTDPQKRQKAGELLEKVNEIYRKYNITPDGNKI